MTTMLDLDRQSLSDTLTAVMGDRLRGGELPFELVPGTVKTYALEVNLNGASAFERLERMAVAMGGALSATADPDLAVLWNEDLGFFADVLDERFWLVHTASHAREVRRLLRRLVWQSRDLDWCWFPVPFVRSLLREGSTRWFKTDFAAENLLPFAGSGARRFRAQLEGDAAPALYEHLTSLPEYQRSTSLTAVALRLQDGALGEVEEVAHYRGRFVARGDSFELHAGLVSRTIDRYQALVRDIETRYQIGFEPDESGHAIAFSGQTLALPLGRQVEGMDQFLDGLFACRDPFRLWSVPRAMNGNVYQAEVVDLHVGQRFSMDIHPEWLRLYLPAGTCGNTVVRLIANLGHHFDATIGADVLGAS